MSRHLPGTYVILDLLVWHMLGIENWRQQAALDPDQNTARYISEYKTRNSCHSIAGNCR
jgi:hypothetical protein